MAIQQAKLFSFSSDPDKARSLGGIDVGEMFNPVIDFANSVQPGVDLDNEDELARQRRQEQEVLDEQSSLQRRQADDQFLAARGVQPNPADDLTDYSADLSDGGYPAPVSKAPPTGGAPSRAPAASKGAIKLSNYGYASDSSPDYNSNVLRIGHANNKLQDGTSAALTKSLASRHGLKTGDMFEIETSDGKKMTRRYDDTVPRTYRGRPLPETVDLYELKGNNSFGGSVVAIRPLTRN